MQPDMSMTRTIGAVRVLGPRMTFAIAGATGKALSLEEGKDAIHGRVSVLRRSRRLSIDGLVGCGT